MHFRELLILGLGLALGAHSLPQGTNPEAGGAALAADNRDPDQGYVGVSLGPPNYHDPSNVGASKRNDEDKPDQDQGYVGAGAAAGYHDPSNFGAAKRNDDGKPDQDQGYVGYGVGKREDADQGYVGV